MKKVLCVPAAVLLLTLIGCKPDPVVEPTPTTPATTLKLRVIPRWQGGEFALNTEYINVSGYRVRPEVIKFYLGDIRLMSGSTQTLLKDIAYFDLSDDVVELEQTISPGSWTSLRAGMGVPQPLNDADPIVYPPGHPLDLAQGTWWTWTEGYRFFQLDGRYELDGSGTGPLTQPFSMHTGLNACYQEYELDLGGTIAVTEGTTTTLTLYLEVDRLFYSATDTLDLETENQTHGTNLPLALELTDNAINALRVE